MKSVAVIGGGITGLTAAFRLQERGVPVTLYEAGTQLGGVIRTARDDGWLVESGPATMLETSPVIVDLVRDLGLESRRRYSDPRADKNFILRDGKLCIAPRSVPAFVTTTLFSLRAKMGLMCEPFIRRAPADADESLADFVRRRLGKEFLDYAINPFVGGIYAGDPERLSVKHGFPKLHAVEQKYGSLIGGQFLGARERKRRGETPKTEAKKFSFDEGLQVMIGALAAKLGGAVHLRSPAASMRRDGDTWFVRAGDEEREHSAVLFTAPAHRLASIKINGDQMLAPLEEIHHPPVAVLALGFLREDVANSLDGFGFLVPEKERRNILGTTFSSTLFANRAPAGHVLLTSYIGGCRAPDLATRDAATLTDLTLRDLQAILGVRGKPAFVHHTLVSKAIPQYEVGYGRFKDLMSDIENKMLGVFFAGSFRDGISLGNSIVSGHDIAGRIAAFVASIPQTATA
jgi:oxygen-dependent protoporphyrinogen oxidase